MAMAEYSIPLDAAQRGRGPYVMRFHGVHRWTHFLAIISFYTLALTGIPLRFSHAPWSAELIHFFGGVNMAGLIHRGAAIVTFVYVFLHVGFLLFMALRSSRPRDLVWGPGSLVPNFKDALDFLRMWRWFFGKGPRPRFSRYSYLEKLDYWGEAWGFFVIGGSGLLLWFPVFFAKFLPGWAFNAATVFHDYESMIAIVFLFTIHFFNVHLRPDKFPLDAVMFTGKATAEYIEEEHPLQTESWPRKDGELVPPAEVVTHAPSRAATILAAIFGYLALGIGLGIIGMILWVLMY
jgi:cytochrome b subunit of formate dehydrogenase